MMCRVLYPAAIAVAVVCAACNSASNASGFSPTAPSSANRSTADVAGSGDVATAACGVTVSTDGGTISVGSGNGVPPGEPPDGGPTTSTGPDSGGVHTSPGGAPPPPGAQVFLTGTVQSVGGSCPSLVLGMGPANAITSETTLFEGACGSIKVGDRIGVSGTSQADGSVAASCVATGL